MGLLRLAIRGVRDLSDHPWAQVFTLMAVTLAAFLAGLFLLLLHNLDQELSKQRGEVTFQVYWAEKADMDDVRPVWDELRNMKGLRVLRTFTPEQAFEELSASMDGEMRADWMGGRPPLPPTALATFEAVETAEGRDWTRVVFDRLKELEGVESVHFNPLQLDLARSWMRVSRGVVWPLVGLLALVAGLIVGNTIKLAQIARLDEVEILRLVGATRTYIQLPMLSGGAALCLAAGAVATGLLKLFQLLSADIINVPPLFIRIDFLPLSQLGALMGGLVLVGVVSSWVAVKE
ncbi:cell division protein FtsX [Desulfohalovibrio reitneri]|uniref:cell division protein FtsX n=1 Tax=Desulfohalovibrio reitneri TaxID=1307759 RepID=UPI000552B2DB|nr:FtsX-like permease family protein [Desulfohalovibrio reitneri]